MKKNIDLILLNVCFVLTVFVFIPSNIYFYNAGEYSYYYYELLFQLLIGALILIFFLVSFSLLLIKKRNIVLPILFSLCILAWLQGYLINWNYGIEDGGLTVVSKYYKNYFIDAAIWISVIAACLVFRKRISQNIAINMSIFLIVIQSLAISYLFFNYEKKLSYKDYYIDETKRYTFSKNENVLLIILDSFQSDVFKEIISEDSEYRSLFKDFTYYPDTTSGYLFTETNISLVLTGQFYTNLQPFESFKRDAFLKDSLPVNFKKKNWNVFLFPLMGQSVYLDEKILDNITEREFEFNFIKQVPMLINSLVRSLPSFFAVKLKNIFQELRDNEGWQGFAADINSRAKLIGKNVFSYYHLGGPHWPLNINENLEFERMQINRENYKRQAKASLKLTGIMIDFLKKNSLYDRATIIVMGDHGALGQGQKFLPNGSDKIGDALRLPAGQGIPLLSIKRNNVNSSDIVFSSDRVSLRDIKDIVELNHFIDRDKKRYFYEYGSIDHDYYGAMVEYSIDGNSWDIESWDKTGTVYSKNKKLVQHAKEIEYNKDYVFDESIVDYIKNGWSGVEGNFVWTDGKIASMSFLVSNTEGDIEIVAEADPYLANGELKNQRVNVSVHNKKVANWNMTETGKTYSAVIPEKLLVDNHIILKFDISNPASPAQHGMSAGERMLGVAFRKIRFNFLPFYKYGQDVSFANTESEKYLISGWYLPENTYRWSKGKESCIKIPVKNISGKMKINFSAYPLVYGKLKKQRVKFIVNNTFVKDLSIDKQGDYSVEIRNIVIKNNILEIKMKYSDASAPADLGLNNDKRLLAVAISNMKIDVQ